jgi:hypothetical protein
MSALVRLYPKEWRARYEDEFLALLEARPPTLGDQIDIARGAIDARLHPQVGPVAPEPAKPTGPRAADLVIARRLGFGSVGGAFVWLATFVIATHAQIGTYRDATELDGSVSGFLALSAIALLVGGLVGQLLWLPSTARLARAGAGLAAVSVVLWILLASLPATLTIGAAAVLGLTALSVGGARFRAWSRAAAAVVVGSVAVTFVAIVGRQIGLIPMPFGLSVLVFAASTAPIWLGVGGSLVTGAVVARPRPTDGPLGAA